MIVYFVRHGQSDANESNVYQGSESPLTARGEKETEFLAERLAELSIDEIVASPYKRTKQTAEIVNRKIKRPVEYSDLLVERRRPSELLGLPIQGEEATPLLEQLYAHINEPNWHYSDEENYFDLRTRTENALDFLEKKSCNFLLVITHGTFLRALTYTMFTRNIPYEPERFLDYWRFLGMSNTGITLCEFYPDKKLWRMRSWNDHAHLHEILA